MNVKQVKERWTLESLLRQLGHQPDAKKSRGHDSWFASPFRPDEGEPSFHIDIRRDIWMDFGLAEEKSGGDLIFFVQTLLRHQGKENSVSAALEWFKQLSGGTVAKIVHNTPERVPVPKQEAFKLLSAKPIFTKALFDYLDERRIDHEVAQRFLKQVYFLHRESGRKAFGLGMENRKGGFDVRNGLDFKSCIGSKDISIIAGQGGETVRVYEGSFDFLSHMTMLKQEGKAFPEHDSIILHTNRLYRAAAQVIRAANYSAVELWLDNDKGGEQGALMLQKELEDLPIIFEPQNGLYRNCKDLNDWWKKVAQDIELADDLIIGTSNMNVLG